jgi:hypothetical protein
MTQPQDLEAAAAEVADELDPIVVEHVEAIRDRFGLRGLRGAQTLIAREIAVAEEAITELP